MPAVNGPSLDDLQKVGDALNDIVVRELRRITKDIIDDLNLSTPEEALDDLTAVRTRWEEVVDTTVLPALRDSFDVGAHAVATPLPPDDEVLVASAQFQVPCVTHDLANTYIETRRNPLVGVSDRTWELMRAQLAEGYRLGEGVEKLKNRLYAASDLSEAKAGVIARTEANGAANAGAIEQVRSTGLPAYKTWNTTGGLRTRATHAHANGQKRLLDEKFQVGGAMMDRPHDPSGPAKETVNCRCSVSFEVDIVRPATLVPTRKSQTPLKEVGSLGRPSGGCGLNFRDEAALMRQAPWMIETTGPARSFEDALDLQEYFARRYDSPQYTRWAEQAHLWHEVEGGPHVREAINAALRGERNVDGETWLNALAEAPLSTQPMYRGMGWPKGQMNQLRIRRMFPPGRGSEVDVPFGAFTTDRSLAMRIADELAGDDGVRLLITVTGRSRAIPVTNWTRDPDAFDQMEALSGGRFRVTYGPAVLEEKAIQVHLRQVGVYRP